MSSSSVERNPGGFGRRAFLKGVVGLSAALSHFKLSAALADGDPQAAPPIPSPDEGSADTAVEVAGETTTPAFLPEVGDLSRGFKIINMGDKYGLDSVNLEDLYQIATNHNRKILLEFYDDIDQSPYKDMPRGPLTEFNKNYARYARGDDEDRVRRLIGQNIPTYYKIIDLLPDGSTRLRIVLGERFHELYPTPEDVFAAGRAMSIGLAELISFGVGERRIGVTFAQDTRILYTNGASNIIVISNPYTNLDQIP